MKKFLKYLFIYAVIGTIIVVFALTSIDKFIYSINQSSTFSQISSESSSEITNAKIKVEDGATSLQFSFNNKYYSYLKDGKVYIKQVADNKDYAVIEDENGYEICYYNLLYDKNLIIYFTKNVRKTGVTNLTLYSFDVTSKKQIEYNTFNISNFSKIKQVDMSPLQNYVYINVETKTTWGINNIVYRIDLFNSMGQIRSGIIIENMISLRHSIGLYYQDKNNRVYRSGASIFKNKVDLIGIDEDDTLYFLNVETNSTVYKLKNGELIDTIELTDSDVVKTYTNYYNVYIVYPTYVIDVSSSEPHRRIAKMSEYVELEAIKDDIMYVRTKDNIIVTTKILSE